MEKHLKVIEGASSDKKPRVLLKTLWRPCRTPKARQEKIKALAQAIQNNAYRINCGKLADCLIAGLLMGMLR